MQTSDGHENINTEYEPQINAKYLVLENTVGICYKGKVQNDYSADFRKPLKIKNVSHLASSS